MKKNVAELLSPAGSYAGFEAVLGAGADAVYVGGTAFGARAYAKNFDTEELLQAIRVAHIHNRKLYMTVNTLIKNREIERDLKAYLTPFYEAGLDAVLVQDFGVVEFLQEYFPELPIHASTQMAVTGPAGMKFLEKQGFARVVAARELSLSELARMHQESPLEIESFIHGALCYSYSGRCLMSSMIGGRSGNRGRCAQPCRLSYQGALEEAQTNGGKELCPLSLKDMNTLALLPEILDAGVFSLKIEGRMKQPMYAAGVTSVYRHYLDLLLENGAEAYQIEKKDQKLLVDLFSRGGSCTGYYDTYNGKEMMAFSNEKKTGEAEILIQSPKTKISGELILAVGELACLRVQCKDKEVSVTGEPVLQAVKQPMDEERIRQQIEKMGQTPFVWETLSIRIQGEVFLPVKQLNELRRAAVAALETALVLPYERTRIDREPSAVSSDEERTERFSLTASCETEQQLDALLITPEITRIYVPLKLAETALAENVQKKELFLNYPEITRYGIPETVLKKTGDLLKHGFSGVLVKDLESAASLLQAGFGNCVMLDSSMYTWNNRALKFWKSQGITEFAAPLELNQKELRHRENQHSEILLYGRIPLMISAQCVRKNLFGCNRKSDRVKLRDRMGAEFPVQCVCDPWKGWNTETAQSCYNIIYNSLPLSLHEEAVQVKQLNMRHGRLSFTTESDAETKQILRAFVNAYEKGETPELAGSFTKGHLKRGAE